MEKLRNRAITISDPYHISTKKIGDFFGCCSYESTFWFSLKQLNKKSDLAASRPNILLGEQEGVIDD